MRTVACESFNDRPKGEVIDTVIIHYTGMMSGEEALERLCDPAVEVSAHYMIEEDGGVFQLVAEEKRAWHAGVSQWAGRENLNHNSIGIELVHPGHEFGYRSFAEMQIDSLLQLLHSINQRHAIPAHKYLGHSDIAPHRKTDPGELFPWNTLSLAGFGIVSNYHTRTGQLLASKGDKGANIIDYKKLFARLGYAIEQSEMFDTAFYNIIWAFQSHWRQSKVTGQLDEGTRDVLLDLLEQSNL